MASLLPLLPQPPRQLAVLDGAHAWLPGRASDLGEAVALQTRNRMDGTLMKMLLVVGKAKYDDGLLIAGAIDRIVYENIDIEECDKMINEMKQSVSLDPTDYDWREVFVNVDETVLQSLFEQPEITAEIEGTA